MPAARRKRSASRRRRRGIGLLVLLLPTLLLLGFDLFRRGDLIVDFQRPFSLYYAGTTAVSVVFWSVLLYAASRRRGWLADSGALLFVGLYTLIIGVSVAFHLTWNVFLSIDGQIHSKSIGWSLLGTLPLQRPSVFGALIGTFAVALILVKLARTHVRPRPWPRLLSPIGSVVVLVAITQVPASYRTFQATSADVLYVHGMVGLVKEHLGVTNDSPDLRVQRRKVMDVPSLTRKPARPRNVILILQESQRADVSCVTYDRNCPLATPWSNAVTPKRMPLRQMRANASTTAISISNLWSGVLPTESRELLHSVPLIWDYADAAGYDTAYWTSQNLMFGNARLYIQDLPVSHQCVATDLDPQADLDTGAVDALLTDRVIEEWGELEEPFLAVIHYANPHYPYIYDPNHAPFQPAEMHKGPEKNQEFLNFYRDVVYLSDMAVGELLGFVRSTEVGKRTVVLYTADHGEAFREHWQLGHTSSIYDEEVLVPSWIDAPDGTLSAEERQSIEKAADEYVFHLDMAPTMLDLLGVWDDPALAPFRSRMIGKPITRPERTLAPVPMTNCTWVWECAFRNWGLMQGPLKVEAREWDSEYHCFDLRQDPSERSNLGERHCAPLTDLARQWFHVMPNRTPPGRPKVNWGK